jgi:cell fate regulator YaaT (PSP1 superfamily)
VSETTEENQNSREAQDESKNSPSNQNSSQKYEKGQVLKFVRVRFPGHAKSYQFITGRKHYTYGQKVVAMSDRGMAVGYINSFPYEITYDESLDPIRYISKVASDDDRVQSDELSGKEKSAEELCVSLVKKHKLNMDVTHVEFTQFGKKAVFYFVAPERVDFRGLVKDLVSELKMRIELRQISIRDRAASLGGIGPCGRQLCCSSFLSTYGKVNIKMAKNQNLSLIPTRLNGLCGQLKCCTQYENDVYTEKRKTLPEIGDFIVTENGDTGKVTKIHILIGQFDMMTDRGAIRRYVSEQYSKDRKPSEDWSFPERFDHITNETSQVIGLLDKQREELLKLRELNKTQPQYSEYFDNEDDFELEDVEGEDDAQEEEEEFQPRYQESPQPDQPQKKPNRRFHKHNKRKDNNPRSGDNDSPTRSNQNSGQKRNRRPRNKTRKPN